MAAKQWFEAFEGTRWPNHERRKTRAEQAEETTALPCYPGYGPHSPERSVYQSAAVPVRTSASQRAGKVGSMGRACDGRRREDDRLGVGGRHSFKTAWSVDCRRPAACRSTEPVAVHKLLAAKSGATPPRTPGSRRTRRRRERHCCRHGCAEAGGRPRRSCGGTSWPPDRLEARQLAAKRGWGNSSPPPSSERCERRTGFSGRLQRCSEAA